MDIFGIINAIHMMIFLQEIYNTNFFILLLKHWIQIILNHIVLEIHLIAQIKLRDKEK